MQWWCAANGVAWSWAWQPYPGVWLFIALLVGGYFRATRTQPRRTRERALFIAGILLLWAALDWPLGPLGAGYLASIHMVQFLLIALLAPPLLILGLPRATLERCSAFRPGAILERATRPLIALGFYNVVVIATHWPEVVDTLMRSQWGSFALDSTWLAGGLALWWPVLSPTPHRPRFHYGAKIGYVLLTTVLMTLPYIFLTFAELPFYSVYELAPPVGTLSAAEDQRLAGLLMRIGGGAILWTAAGVLFWLWYRSETADRRGES